MDIKEVSKDIKEIINPLVSIGVPVRNGGDMLREALEQITGQSYQNLEIIISDNNSDDSTRTICLETAQRDARIKYFRQNETKTAAYNYRFVLEKASGEYFMWAAHDDRRDMNYVASLVKVFAQNRDCVLAYPKIYYFRPYLSEARLKDKPVNVVAGNLWEKTKRVMVESCAPVYGLMKKEVIFKYRWDAPDYSGDRPFLSFLCTQGEFCETLETAFYYYVPSEIKTLRRRAEANAFRRLKPFLEVRRSYACAKAICFGEQLNQRKRLLPCVFIWALFFRIKKQYFSGLIARLSSVKQRLIRREMSSEGGPRG